MSKGVHTKTEFKKKHIPWNKGLTKLTELRLKNSALKRTRRIHRKCLRCGQLFEIVPSKKKKYCSSRCVYRSKEFRDVQRLKFLGKKQIKQSETKKRLFKEGKLVVWNKDLTAKDHLSIKVSSLKTKERWKNPLFKENTVRAILKSCSTSPNKTEIFLINFLDKILPQKYRFVGDGEFILGGKCPDFLNIDGKKKLIELFGNYWHKGEDPQNRINYFKKLGFDTLVIWEKELLNLTKLKTKIFTYEKHIF